MQFLYTYLLSYYIVIFIGSFPCLTLIIGNLPHFYTNGELQQVYSTPHWNMEDEVKGLESVIHIKLQIQARIRRILSFLLLFMI